jgi:hypothetical protein
VGASASSNRDIVNNAETGASSSGTPFHPHAHSIGELSVGNGDIRSALAQRGQRECHTRYSLKS